MVGVTWPGMGCPGITEPGPGWGGVLHGSSEGREWAADEALCQVLVCLVRALPIQFPFICCEVHH